MSSTNPHLTAAPNPTDTSRSRSAACQGKTFDIRWDQLESTPFGDVLAAFADLLAPLMAARLGSATDVPSPYMSVAEAAEYMRCQPQRVYDLCSARRLTKFKDGSRTLLHRDEIDAYLAGRALPSCCPPSRSTASARVSRAA